VMVRSREVPRYSIIKRLQKSEGQFAPLFHQKFCLRGPPRASSLDHRRDLTRGFKSRARSQDSSMLIIASLR